MDRTEKAFFILLDGIFFLPLFCLIVASSVSALYAVLVALLIGHTMHWLFNGHVYVLVKKLGYAHTDKKRFTDYTAELSKRVSREPSIVAAAAFGSLSRGQLTEHSDLDVRIIRRGGAINGIRACFFTFLERSRALLGSFPLDIYTLDSLAGLRKEKLRSDEPPIILYDPENILRGGDRPINSQRSNP
jgi:predicted nucleotidyltransferase